jgi:hypothetical protein
VEVNKKWRHSAGVKCRLLHLRWRSGISLVELYVRNGEQITNDCLKGTILDYPIKSVHMQKVDLENVDSHNVEIKRRQLQNGTQLY